MAAVAFDRGVSSSHGRQEAETEGWGKMFLRTHPSNALLPPTRSHLLWFPEPLKIVPPARDHVQFINLEEYLIFK